MDALHRMAGPAGIDLDLDLEHLARQCGGDRDLERDLLTLFDAQCRVQGAALLAAASPAGRRDAAHALLGSAASLGARRLATLCAAIEDEARAPGGAGPAMTAALPAALAAARAAAALRLAALAKPDRVA